MDRIAILIPGLMGSSLSYDDGTQQAQTIWSEDVPNNYQVLLRDPKLLSWKGKMANASLMRQLHAGWWPVPKYQLWNRTIAYLCTHPEFKRPNGQLHFGYDWRQSLIETSDVLCATLAEKYGDDVAAPPPPRSATRFVMIAHSMGGVLLQIALGLGKLHPDWVERFFVIGSPLKGAPQAFSSLYSRTSPLPLFVTLTKIFYGRNQQRFLENYQECVQSFPSIYQLLPHIDSRYLFYGSDDRRNVLDFREGHVPQEYREHARQAHDAMQMGSTVIEQAHLSVFAIFTKEHFKETTELEYRVRPTQKGYSIDEVVGRTKFGDGTVPSESAHGSISNAILLDLESVDHLKMCDDRKVVDRLTNYIN